MSIRFYNKIFLTAVNIIFYSTIFSQTAPSFIEGYNHGGTSADYTTKSIWTFDSTIVLCGRSYSNDIDLVNNFGLADYWVSEMDTSGNLLTSKNIGGSSLDFCHDLIQIFDSSFIIVGTSYSNDFDISANFGVNDFWVVRLDKNLNLIWEKSFGGSNQEEAYSIFAASDGNLVISGYTISNDGDVADNNGSSDFWIIKITTNGELIWERNFGGNDLDVCEQGLEMSNGNYAFGGWAWSNNGDVVGHKGGTDYWLITCDPDGNLLSSNCYGSASYENCYALLEFNNQLVLAGRIQDSGGDILDFNGGFYDIWLVAIDTIKEIIWSNNFGGNGNEEPYELIQTGDNGILIVSETSSTDGDISFTYSLGLSEDFWIIAIDSMGLLNWEKSLGGAGPDIARNTLKSLRNTYYVSGYTGSIDGLISNNFGSFDQWTAKLRFCNNSYFLDTDGDGFGDITNDSMACNMPIGYVSDSTDCNDTNPDIHPLLSDICNSIDDNCNGATDEDAIFTTYYLDNDGDLFGDIVFDTTSCNVLIGFVENSEDCNDLNSEINPLINETCNGIDDNCNIEIDEALTIYTLYADVDGDTFGNPDGAVDTCIETIDGYVNNGLDCNDTLATIYPSATELCNYLDDDCDGLADENLTYILSYQDNDDDDFGNPLNDSLSCELPVGYVVDNTDCDDTNATIYPGAEEVLNGIDDDCDQIADEGLAVNAIVKNTIHIFPNPVNTILFIQSDETQNITIVNQLGEKIFFANIFIGLNTISVENFPSGMYWVKAENGEIVVWVKE